MIAFSETASGTPLYQLKITLKHSKPAIWRRLIVRADTKLPRLHTALQIIFGWEDYHLHQFIIGSGAQRVFIGTPDPDTMQGWGPETLNEKQFTVARVLSAPKKKILYEYDFGDGWEHEILLEKVLPPDPAFKHPICVAGANAGPPEDCGGIWGYYGTFLKALNDPKHPEHETYKEWIGGSFDPTHFDLAAINAFLKKIKR